MLRFLSALGGFLFIVLIAVLAAPLLIPSEWIRDRVIVEIEAATGRDLQVRGDFGLSVFPEIALEIEDVEISGPGGVGRFASLGELRVRLALAPLLDRRVDITGLTLVRPDIDLTAEDAAPTGDGGTAGDPGTPPDSDPDTDASGSGFGLAGVSIARLRIVDGRLTLPGGDGPARTVTGIELDTALPDLTGPITASGAFTIGGRRFTTTLDVAAPLALSEGRASGVTLALATDGADARFAGRIDPAGAASGDLGLSATQLPRLLADLGIAADVPVTSLKAAGRVSAGGGRIDVTRLDVTADGLGATGEAALDTTGARPRLDARLALPALDLDRLPAGTRGSAPGGTQGGAEGRSAAGAVDLSPLASFDAGLAVSIGRVDGSALGSAGPVTDVAVTAVVENGRLDAVVERMAVAGGQLTGRLAARPGERGARLDGRVEASGFDVTALAALAGQRVPVTGALSANLAFAAEGATTTILRESLNAAGDVALARGGITGLGLAATVGDPAADRLDDVALTARFASLDAPVAVAGRASWRGTPYDVAVTVDPRRIIAGGRLPLDVEIDGAPLRLAFGGTVDPDAGSAEGRLDLSTPSLPGLARLAGRVIDGLPAGAASVSGRIAAGPSGISVSGGRYRLAGADMSGDIAVGAGPRPTIAVRLDGQPIRLAFDGEFDTASGRVSGRLDAGAASLGALAAFAGQPAADLPPGEVAIAGTIAAGAGGVSIDRGRYRLAGTDLSGDIAVALAGRPRLTARLEGEAVDLGVLLAGAAGSGDVPGARGAAPAAAGWSDAPIDLSGLGRFDADVTIRAGRVRFDRIEAGPAALSGRLEAGRLVASLGEFGLYAGSGSGEIVLDGAGAVPTLSLAMKLAGVDALPLLDAAGFRRIAGRMEATLELKASGASQRALVSTLTGGASFRFSDGAVLGIDVPRLLGLVASSVVEGWVGGDATPFHSLGASFSAAEGRVRTSDLALAGPLVRATGVGVVDLPARSLAFRINPEVLAGGGRGVLGFEVPVIVEGPWDRPRIYPDISGILNDPAAAYARLRELGGGFSALSRNPEQVLGRLAEGLLPALGGGAGSGGGAPLSTGNRDIDALLGGLAGPAAPGGAGGAPSGGLGGLLGGLFGNAPERPAAPSPAPPPGPPVAAGPPAEPPTTGTEGAAPPGEEPRQPLELTRPGDPDPFAPPPEPDPAAPAQDAAPVADPGSPVPLPRPRPFELPPREAIVPQQPAAEPPAPETPAVPPPDTEPPLDLAPPAPADPTPTVPAPAEPAPEPALEPQPAEPQATEPQPDEPQPDEPGADDADGTGDPLLDLLQQVVPQ